MPGSQSLLYGNAGDSDADGFRISPNIFMSIFALILGCIAYIISSTSLGKRSISHAWLFSGLLVLNPSAKSLKILGTAAQCASDTTPRRRNPTIKDVAGLELTVKSILPGAIPLSLMTKKDRASFLQWQALDAAVSILLACVVATASPFVLAWYTVYREGNVCCGDLKCWLRWWREHLGGPGLIYTDSPPPNLMLVAIAGVAIWFWWRLVIYSTRLPERSVFRFSPLSYINGWLTIFATLFLLRYTIKNTITTTTLTSFIGVPLNDALEEWSARITLWIGLTGFYDPKSEAPRELIIMKEILYYTQLLFAATTGLIAFAVADPLRVTMRVYFGNAFGDQVNVVDTTIDKYTRFFRKTKQQCSMVTVAFLPVLCMSSYFVPVAALRGFSPQTVRAALGWSFIATLAIIVRPLLRNQMLAVLPEINLLFSEGKKPTSEEIVAPFQNRSKRLLSTGGQLLVFPALALLVLTLGHSAGKQPTAVSDNDTITVGIYPFAFHSSLWTADEQQRFREWEEFQAKASAQDHLDDISILADLSTTRANFGLCPNNTSFSFLGSPTGDDIAVKGSKYSSRKLQGYSAPIYHISKSSQLITSEPFTKTTFVRVLRRLQQLAGKGRDKTADETTKKSIQAKAKNDLDIERETLEARHDFQSFLQAMAFHPLLTSTVLLPVLDFFGFLLNYLWIVYFAYFGIESWAGRHSRRRYDVFIKGEDVRVRLASL